MQRITGPTAVDIGGGRLGFRDENLGAGIEGTDVLAAWLNGVQEEIAGVIEGAGLALNGAVLTQLREAIRLLTTGRLINVRVFNVPGTSVYVPTAGTGRVLARVCGGGGAGAGARATGAGQRSLGSGGAAGGSTVGFFASGFTGVPITVGAGGAGVAGGAGGTGGTSAFGALLSATGGPGGAVGPVLNSGVVDIFGQTGGGIGIGGFLVAQGGSGRQAVYATTPISGPGGASMFGEGAPGVTGTSSGLAAVTPGAGGSGGACGPDAGIAAIGGPGAPGLVMLEEYW